MTMLDRRRQLQQQIAQLPDDQMQPAQRRKPTLCISITQHWLQVIL
jgi:hypothetical protein